MQGVSEGGGVGGILTPALFITGGFDLPGNFDFFRFFFSNIYEKLRNLNVYKIKWTKIEKNHIFLGR